MATLQNYGNNYIITIITKKVNNIFIGCLGDLLEEGVAFARL